MYRNLYSNGGGSGKNDRKYGKISLSRPARYNYDDNSEEVVGQVKPHFRQHSPSNSSHYQMSEGPLMSWEE